MYTRLAMKLCERSLYRGFTNIRLRCSTLSHTITKKDTEKDIKKPSIDLLSKKFPGYKVIYVFPFIHYAFITNMAKRNLTYFTGLLIPVMIGLRMVDIIPDIAETSIITALLLSAWVHVSALVCNNLVGLIYINLEEEKVILSYTNYWGQRTDLKTDINDVIPLSDNRLRFTDPLYKTILFVSHKQKLKITLSLGQIMDKENFKCVLGMV